MLTAMLHEMGHALGLDDLYGEVAGNFTGYLMGSLTKHDAATVRTVCRPGIAQTGLQSGRAQVGR